MQLTKCYQCARISFLLARCPSGHPTNSVTNTEDTEYLSPF